MLLKINSLLIKRGNKILIRDFNLIIQKSQIIAISGSNGIGKSTLLETISGLQKNYDGEINFFNQDNINKGLNRSGFFFLGHLNALKDELSVLDNLKIWAQVNLLCFKDSELKKKLHYFNLNDLSNLKFNRLSFGQKRKVALTKLLLTQAKFWILDEPCNGLDSISEQKFIQLILKHQSQGGTVIFTSHKKYKNKNFILLDLNLWKPNKILKINSNIWENL